MCNPPPPQKEGAGVGCPIQQRNFVTFTVEDPAHYSERTLVRAEYGYPKGSPNTNS
jgi:hypothetical protein